MADNGEWQTNVNDRKQGKINNGKWLKSDMTDNRE